MKEKFEYWWANDGLQFVSLAKYPIGSQPTDGYSAFHGPFKTLADCKRDCIAYYKHQREDAHDTMKQVRKIKL